MTQRGLKSLLTHRPKQFGVFLSRNKKNPRLWVTIFALAGVFMVALSKASGFSFSIESEVGSTLAGCASKITDSTASSGGAVQFGCIGSTPTLDSSGNTIPSYGYSVPTTNVIYMAPNGNDSNNGATNSPVATLSKAVSLAPSNGTVVVRGGLYRQGEVQIAKNVTVLGFPNEQAWFSGADVVASNTWTSDGQGHWYRQWDTPSFCGGLYYTLPFNAQNSNNSGPCTHFDQYGDPNYPAAGDPQQVFINDVPQREVGTLAQATAGKFYYDWAAHRMYIGTDPNGKTVELTARAQAFVLNGGSTYTYTIKGIGIKRYGSNEHEAVTTSGAVYIGALSSTVEKVVFTENAGRALAYSNPKNGASLKNSVFAFNGYNGLGANGAWSKTIPNRNDFVIDGNIFNNNNTEHFGTNCTKSCAAAGVKIGNMYGYTLKNNIFENNQGVAAGFWCDPWCTEGVMVNNISRYNGGDGIFYEISDKGIIASNVVYGNGYVGIRSPSSTTKIYNNTSVNNAVHNIWAYDDPRAGGTTGTTIDSIHVGPDTVSIELANNILYGQGKPTLKFENHQTVADNYVALLNNNSYYRPSGGTKLVNWGETFYNSLALLRADPARPNRAIYETAGRDISDGSNPFVDLTNGNFNLKAGSPDINSGLPLPADVAAALGLASGTVQNRGAISWPGK